MNQALQPHNSDYDIGFHEQPLMASWMWLANFTLIIAAISWHKFSFYIHALIGIIIIVLTLLGTLHILMEVGIHFEQNKHFQYIHNLVGLTVVILLVIQLLSGILARVIQYSAKIQTNFCIWVKRSHHIFSYIIIILSKFNYFIISYRRKKYSQCLMFIVFDMFFIAIYLLVRFKYYSLSEEIVQSQLKDEAHIQNQTNSVMRFLISVKNKVQQIIESIEGGEFNIPKIKYLPVIYQSEKQITLPKYIIFNDFVYDIQPFQQLHPGGEKVIKEVNRREVDRFLYGYYPPQQTPNIIMHKHSKDSLKLCGQPIAKIERISPMKNIPIFSKMRLQSCQKISKNSSVYLIHLAPQNLSSQNWLSFKYSGFEAQNQIGQYFSLTICNQKGKDRNTRLYTTVWCMRPNNIQFMLKNYNIGQEETDRNQIKNHEMISNEIKINIVNQQIIPLVIKRYQDGQMTPKFINSQFKGEIILSSPMGGGIKYHDLIDGGKVIFICGGTGLLPFYDIIDLLFKRVKYLQKTNLSQAIAQNDPLVKKDLIKSRQFILCFSCDSNADISPIIIYQINYLCSSQLIRFRANIRIKDQKSMFSSRYKHIKIQPNYFNQNLDHQLKNVQDICKIYICGPPRMNQSLIQILKKRKVNQSFYCFM